MAIKAYRIVPVVTIQDSLLVFFHRFYCKRKHRATSSEKYFPRNLVL